VHRMKGVGWSYYGKTGTCREDDEKDPQLRSRLIEILNVPHSGKELFRQLGVGRVRMLRLRLFLTCGLAGVPV